MPFRPTKRKFTKGKRKGQKVYVSPSGRRYNARQVRAYYATGGWKRSVRKRRRRKR